MRNCPETAVLYLKIRYILLLIRHFGVKIGVYKVISISDYASFGYIYSSFMPGFGPIARDLDPDIAWFRARYSRI